MTKRIVLAAALLVAPAYAMAEQPNLYWGVSLGEYTADARDFGGGTEDTTDFGLRLGYHFSDFLGLEFRGGRDTGGFAGGGDADTEYVGVFARLDIPLEKINIYVLLGASELRFNDESFDGDEESAGLGIELYGSERTAISLEYMSYSFSDGGYSGVSLGIKHHFQLPSLR